MSPFFIEFTHAILAGWISTLTISGLLVALAITLAEIRSQYVNRQN